jgi:anti-sigma regulatory factor (Ser/Thr protein kinase)
MNLEIELPATHSALLACLETIGDFGAAAKLTPDLVARARIVVEELYSNTIKYGYGEECDRRVWLRLSAEGSLTVIYEDDAPTFDPTSWALSSGEGDGRPSAAESPREGQAGLALMFGLASSVAYEPRAEGNRLVVIFDHLPPLSPPVGGRTGEISDASAPSTPSGSPSPVGEESLTDSATRGSRSVQDSNHRI